MGGKRIVVGDRSGQLVVLESGVPRHDLATPGAYSFLCLCEKCGQKVQITNMQFRRRKMCNGCSGVRGANLRTRHGGSRRANKNLLYKAWQTMRNRCENPNSESYEWYGARGITVCDAWQDFAVFQEWALTHGYGLGMTLDRLNAHRGYSPDNCEYVTKSENSRRMRESYVLVPKGMVFSMAYDEPWNGDY